MKKCNKCKVTKELTEFYFRLGKSGNKKYSYICKACHKNKMQKNYTDNIEFYKDRAKKARQKMREFVIQQKDFPCKDCGVKYPHYVMDFDRLGNEEKSFNVGTWRNQSKQDVMNEIAKCDLVCSNCHRERTFKRLRFVVRKGEM